MATPSVYAGAVAPEALRVTITPEAGSDPLDLTTVTACSLRVTGGGAETFWATVIESATATSLVVVHEFAVSDVPTHLTSPLRIMPHLTVPGGTRRCVPFNLNVSR